jgi:hypothetical protein
MKNTITCDSKNGIRKRSFIQIFFVCLFFSCWSNAQIQIQHFEVRPSAPTTTDTIRIITHTTTSSMGEQLSTSFSAFGEDLILEKCFSLGVNTAIGSYKDTLLIYPSELPSGNYTVRFHAHATYNQQDCSPIMTAKDSINISIGFLNTQEANLSNSEVVVFPNPSQNTNTLVFNKTPTAHTTIDLYDFQGRLVQPVFKGDIAVGMEITVDLSGLSSGMYLYRITNNHSQQAIKFVKE